MNVIDPFNEPMHIGAEVGIPIAASGVVMGYMQKLSEKTSPYKAIYVIKLEQRTFVLPLMNAIHEYFHKLGMSSEYTLIDFKERQLEVQVRRD